MKRWMRLAAFGMASAVAWAAEDRFSQTVKPDDFSSAGLGKLSPAELERLDALVRDFNRGAGEPARRETPPPPPAAPAAASEGAQKPAATAKSGGLLARAKVILAPGTEIEYSTVESRIVGEFRGWQPRSTFTLENGQRWQVESSDSYVGPILANPGVKISPGVLGSFWMTIDGVKRRVKVKLIGGP